MSRVRAAGTHIVLLACSTVGGFEACRQTAYPDPATRGPPWTACYGDTHGIHYGDHFTMAQCDERLRVRMKEFGDHIEACAPALKTAPEKVYVSHLSLSYNIGWGAYCKSSVARHIDEGDILAACEAILAWDKVHGITFPGLTNRRKKERTMCIEGYMGGRLGLEWRA